MLWWIIGLDSGSYSFIKTKIPLKTSVMDGLLLQSWVVCSFLIEAWKMIASLCSRRNCQSLKNTHIYSNAECSRGKLELELSSHAAEPGKLLTDWQPSGQSIIIPYKTMSKPLKHTHYIMKNLSNLPTCLSIKTLGAST